MAHIDENINAKYCQLCKKNVAMNTALFNTTYVCELCMTKLRDTLRPLEVIRTEGFDK